MKNPKVSLPAIITKLTTMADGGIRVQVDTQEIEPEESSGLFSLKGKVGYFFFDPKEIKSIDVSNLPEIQLDDGEVSPSKRQRAVLYRIWEAKGKGGDFELFYRRFMERHIEGLKEKHLN